MLNLFSRSLPKHERLVDLHGSVIDYGYGGGSSIAVLLIMERLHRDLYTGLKVRGTKAAWVVLVLVLIYSLSFFFLTPLSEICSWHAGGKGIYSSCHLTSVLCWMGHPQGYS